MAFLTSAQRNVTNE